MKKKLPIALALLLAVAAILVQSTMGFRNLIGMLRYDQRREGKLKVGDKAPDVALVGSDGKSGVRLLESMNGAMRGKPLILVFGSYT